MKKNLLALTVVGALTLGAAQAETVLYGSVRMDYGSNKNDIKSVEGLSDLKDNFKQRTSKFGDQGSRFGIKGGESLGNGLDVIFHLEWGFDGMSDDNFKTRLAYVGFTGDWGTAVVGRVNNTFKQTLVDDSVIDDFNGVGTTATTRAAYNVLLGGYDGTSGNVLHGNLDRVGNTIAYMSPNWSGFSFNAALIADGFDEKRVDANGKPLGGNKKHVDFWTINAAYEHDSGFYAKLGYIQGMTNADAFRDDKDRKANVWGAQLGFRNEQFAVSGAYSDGKLKESRSGNAYDKRKAKGWDVGASYSFGDNYASTVRLNYGEARYTFQDGVNEVSHFEAKPKEKIWAVGFEQKLSERTRVWVEYENQKISRKDRTNNVVFDHGKAKNDNVSIGIRHDF